MGCPARALPTRSLVRSSLSASAAPKTPTGCCSARMERERAPQKEREEEGELLLMTFDPGFPSRYLSFSEWRNGQKSQRSGGEFVFDFVGSSNTAACSLRSGGRSCWTCPSRIPHRGGQIPAQQFFFWSELDLLTGGYKLFGPSCDVNKVFRELC